MFRTIKLWLLYDKVFVETASPFKEATPIVLDYGLRIKHSTRTSSIKERRGLSGKGYLHYPSALVQTVRDTASED
jgi:hypothetical protein